MITFPHTVDEAATAVGEKRAGGLDVQERYRSGISAGPLVDLSRLTELQRIEWGEDDSLRIGALVRLARLLDDPRFVRVYPGLAEAIASIATPQIRTVGTVGGNLLQSPRCAYYHHPEILCSRKGGTDCPARLGNHLYSVCFDSRVCIAPSPSTLGMALLAYDASVQFYGEPLRPLYHKTFINSSPSNDAEQGTSPLLLQVTLPPARGEERAAYRRITSRACGDWPLVEVLVCLEVRENIQFARVVVGGVAPTPLRLHDVEALLVGRPATAEVLEKATAVVDTQANPLPFTGYKVHLLRACVLDTLLSLQKPSQKIQ